MEGQVPEKIKTERSEVIRAISEANRIGYMESMIGKKQRVLIEKVDPQGMAHGYGEHYLPVTFRTGSTVTNRFQEVELKELIHSAPPGLMGSAISP
jgi:threonylcarbamoyladenosine tRNA methylthiotransferase MtaB